MTDEKLLSMNELCKVLGVSRLHLYKLIKQGVIPDGYKLGSIKRWSLSEVYDALKQEREKVKAQEATA